MMRRLMRACVAMAIAILVSGVVAGCTPARLKSPRARLEAAESWALAIGDGMLAGEPETVAARFADYDLVVVDGVDATPEHVAALQDEGTLVVGYLSIGTIEPDRPWTDELMPNALELWQEWGEYYADVSAEDYRTIVTGEVAPDLLGKGFDGLFIDNIDMVATHSNQALGMSELVVALSTLVHQEDGVLIAQNGFGVIEQLQLWGSLDGWNREDVSWTYDFEHEQYLRADAVAHLAAIEELTAARERGVVTFATDYTAEGDRQAALAAVEAAEEAGALPFVSDIGLTRLTSGGVR